MPRSQSTKKSVITLDALGSVITLASQRFGRWSPQRTRTHSLANHNYANKDYVVSAVSWNGQHGVWYARNGLHDSVHETEFVCTTRPNPGCAPSTPPDGGGALKAVVSTCFQRCHNLCRQSSALCTPYAQCHTRACKREERAMGVTRTYKENLRVG